MEKCDKTKTQKWTILGNQIVNIENPNKVLCLGVRPENSANVVGLVSCHRRDNSPLWDVVKYEAIQSTTPTANNNLDDYENGPIPNESEEYDEDYYE